MRKSEAFPSRFWKAADLDEPVVLEVAFVTREKLESRKGKVEDKSIVHFTNNKRQLVLNATNWDSISDICGEDDTDLWPGIRIEIFPTTTEVGGETKPAIRVRAPQEMSLKPPTKPTAKSAPKPTASSEPKPPLKDETGDEIPW